MTRSANRILLGRNSCLGARAARKDGAPQKPKDRIARRQMRRFAGFPTLKTGNSRYRLPKRLSRRCALQLRVRVPIICSQGTSVSSRPTSRQDRENSPKIAAQCALGAQYHRKKQKIDAIYSASRKSETINRSLAPIFFVATGNCRHTNGTSRS